MNLDSFNSPLPKPWLMIKSDTLDANTITCNNLNANTINNDILFQASSFNGGCGGFLSPITLGIPMSGSTTQSTQISIPNSYWILSDCKLTYNGPSGWVFYYGTGAGFLTDTTGTYNFSIYVNGIQNLTNLNVTCACTSSAVIVGQITGLLSFNNGDYIQVGMSKGSDIPGSPIVNVFGMGFVLFRVS